MAAVSKGNELDRRLKNADPKAKVQMIRALQSNNVDYRLEFVAKTVFKDMFQKIVSLKDLASECEQTLKQATLTAMSKDYVEENGSISWKKLCNSLTGDDDDDELTTMLKSLGI